MIRSWLSNIFENFLNIAFILSAIGIVIFALAAGVSAGSGYGGSVVTGFMTTVVTLIVGGIFLVLSYGLIYVQLDIRASLKTLVDLKASEKQ